MTIKLYDYGRYPIMGVLIAAGLSLSLFACSENEENQPLVEEQEAFSGHEVGQALIAGYVTDTWGDVVVGAMLEIEQRGEILLAYTDENGAFSREVDTGEYRITVSGFGYLDLHVTGELTAGAAPLQLNLIQVEFEGFFEAAEGMTLIQEDAILILPENGFVYEDGNPVEGPIDYSISYFSPDDALEMDAAPPLGEFDSLGIVSVDFFANEEPVNLGPGFTALLQIPVPENMPLNPLPEARYFDPVSFEWISGAQTEIVQTENGPMLQATVTHFSWWGFLFGDWISICHIPRGNPLNVHTINTGFIGAVLHILFHGDFLGSCIELQEQIDDCTPAEAGGEQTTIAMCSDGLDNDGDGLVDYDDPDCHRLERFLINVRRALIRIRHWFGLWTDDYENPDPSESTIDFCDDTDHDDYDEVFPDGGDDEEPYEPPVTLCHIPPGNSGAAHTLTVGAAAQQAHLDHGDTLGACDGDAEPPEPTEEVCDGVDNDNDGIVDNADLVCWSGSICVEIEGQYHCQMH